MIRIKYYVLTMLAMLALSSCDETTDNVGASLTNDVDRFTIIPDTFGVATSTIEANAVLSNGAYSYLGHVKDTETGSYVTSSYASQFSISNSLTGGTLFPKNDSIRSLDTEGKVVADSCILNIYFYSSQGDSLNAMKLSAYEMEETMEEGVNYYTDFDPEAAGMLREGANAIRKSKVFTPVDLNYSDSLRAEMADRSSFKAISIPLNDKYIDKNGDEYDNYGTYIMRKYYDSSSNHYFDNSYSFIHNVCPGFFMKITDGVGVMSEVRYTDLSVYFKYISNDTLYVGATTFSGNEEVLQTTHVVNDQEMLDNLMNDNSCTYLKTPAGLFTRVEIPVDDIMKGHENDTISSAKLTFTCYNLRDDEGFGPSDYILLLPEDSIKSFFENKDIPDAETSYLASYTSSSNLYTFSNISNLVTEMYNVKKSGTYGDNWNKAVLIPVTVTTSGSSSTTVTYSSVVNNMALSSVRLKKGDGTQASDVKISVIYNKFSSD